MHACMRMQGGEPAWQQRNNSTAYLGFLVFGATSMRHDERPQTLALGHGLPNES